jgi:hypothetical protein
VSASTTKTQPLYKRLKYAFNIGASAGIFSALLHIIIVLSNASIFQKAAQEIITNKLTVNTALTLLTVQSVNFFVSLLIYFIAGFLAGKMAERRSLGFFSGIIAGLVFSLILLLLSYIPFYPDQTTIGKASIIGGSMTISLVVLGTWIIIAGLVSLLGAWLATRKHPHYQ